MSFRLRLNRVIPARFLIYLGFILLPFANTVNVVLWALDPHADPRANRPEYPASTALLILGLFLVLVGPWLTSRPLLARFTLWVAILIALILYLFPLYLLWISTGVYIRT